MGIRLKEIFENEWDSFVRSSDSEELKRPAVIKNIWKMLHCKTLWLGLQVYQCEKHQKVVRVVPNTCKSRFCPSCGYKANLVWLNKLLEKALPCDHQHLIFTLPWELRDLAKHNRRKIFNLMSRCLWRTIKQFINKQKNLGYQPGAVAILHTFGKGLKWHIHFHVLITAGGIKDDRWIENSYLNENYLKKTWKAKMLAGLRKLYRSGQLVKAYGRVPGQSFEQMLTEIYENNWYIWLDQVTGDCSFAFVYIGRYARRHCIAQKGIIKYRQGKIVEWKERSKIPAPDICANRATPHEFIELLITHIPNRYDHQIFYYGLYSSRQKNSLYQKACQLLGKESKPPVELDWPKLMQWTHDFNPLACPECGQPLKFTCMIFFNPASETELDLILNYEVKNYELVAKKIDTS